MADASDVETALVTLAATALYPAGTTNGSLTGGVIRVYRGFPGNSALEADLAASIAHVSVTAIAGGDTAIDQFPQIWEYPSPAAPALTVNVTDGVITFGGNATLGQLAGLLVDDDAFVYRTATGDTAASVAANLAGLVNQIRVAGVSGSTITLPGAMRLIGRVVADQTALMQTRRQRGDFRLTCWCPDPVGRDALAAAIDGALATTHFIALPDSSVGRLRILRSETIDDLSTLPLYRRDLDYSVEYATTIVQTQPSMIVGLFGIAGANTALHLS